MSTLAYTHAHPEPSTCLSSVNTSASPGLQIIQTQRRRARMQFVIIRTPLHNTSIGAEQEYTHVHVCSAFQREIW